MMMESKNLNLKRYDYGHNENMKIYGQSLPTEWNFRRINFQVELITGGGDLTCNKEAADKFSEEVNKANNNKLVRVNHIEGWNHLAFFTPRNPKKLFDIYEKIFEEK